jgi:hypothetical protein
MDLPLGNRTPDGEIQALAIREKLPWRPLTLWSWAFRRLQFTPEFVL